MVKLPRATSLLYLKKDVNKEVNFLHADKHESFLQVETMILMRMVKHSQSYVIVGRQFYHSPAPHLCTEPLLLYYLVPPK